MKRTFKTYLKRNFNKWSMLTLAIVGFIAIPVITICYKLFSGPGESWDHIVQHVLPDYTLNTLWLIFGCTILSVLFGVSSAWIVSRYHFPLRKPLEWMLILPLTIPSYIVAYAYAGFFDYGGSFEQIQNSLGWQPIKFDMLSLTGLILVLSVSLFPYIYVATRAVFLFQSSRLIEVSKLLGASEWRIFSTIALPIARPAIVGGLILVLMEVLNDYGAAKYYGVNTYTTGIFRAWFSLEEPESAVYLSALLLIIVFFFIGLELLQRGQRRFNFTAKSYNRLPRRHLNKKWRVLALVLVLFPVLLGFLLPVGQLLYWSFLTFERVASVSFLSIAIQSLGISFLTAILTVLIALMILYFSTWNRLGIIKKSPKVAILGYAIPGAIIAIGIMIPFINFDKWIISVCKQLFNADIGFVINGTIIILVYAYIIRYLVVAFNPIEAGKTKIPEMLTEASTLLGRNKLRTFFSVHLPLLRTSLLSAFILVFIDIMKELPLTLILKPYDINTLAVKAYEYASDELVMEASIPSLCIIIVGLIPIIYLNKHILNEKE